MEGLNRSVFLELNDDVLLLIFKYLWPDGGLRQLSVTSRSMREATIPMLFSQCKVFVKGPIDDVTQFIPRALWPYVRKLSLIDRCPDLMAMRDPSSKLMSTDDPLLCGVMSATFLKTALQAMPLLHSVSLEIRALELHGIGWDSLLAILSIPQLRNFMIGTFLFSPREAPQETWTDTLAPVTTFHYKQYTFSPWLLKYLAQRDSLIFVLTRLHRSLESLHLPSEIAPTAVLARTQWPQLRELSLSGEFRPSAEHAAPLISLFSGMPQLRILNLALGLPKDVDRKELVFWPRDYESRLPWPHLEALTVSFPDPEDQIFAHLPPSLRRLSLRCSPYHCFKLWEPDEHLYRHSPILHASEMLEVVAGISTPLLEYLQLEYRADEADDDLLRCISEQFPSLQTLEVHRFLASRDDAVPAASIGKRLAALHSLRTLRAHLELPEPIATPRPVRTAVHGYQRALRVPEIPNNTPALCETAAALRSVMPQPGLALWLLRREDYGANWGLFRQVVNLDGISEESPQAELDPACEPGMPLHVFG